MQRTVAKLIPFALLLPTQFSDSNHLTFTASSWFCCLSHHTAANLNSKVLGKCSTGSDLKTLWRTNTRTYLHWLFDYLSSI